MPNSSKHSDEAQGSNDARIPSPSVAEGSRPILLTEQLPGGVPIKIAGNRPLYASDETAFYMVSRGRVDLFAVKMAEGRAVGVRTHLFQIVEGDLLFGMAHQEGGHGLGLLAVGKPGTEIIRFDRTVLMESLRSADLSEAALKAVEIWVIRMCGIMGLDGPPPGNYLNLAPGTTVTAREGDIIRAETDVTWVRLLSGEVNLAGDPAFYALETRVPFPLSRELWLRARGSALVSGFTTQRILDDGEMDPALNRFHETVFQTLAAGERKKQERDRSYFDQRRAEDRRRLENAFYRLGAMLSRKPAVPETSIRSGTPLVDAAAAVAEASGIPTGKFSDVLIRKAGGPELDDIARACHFFTRRVILTPGWSGQDGGPLLGLLEDDGDRRFVALLPLSPRRYELFDPEKGTRIPVTREWEERLSKNAWTFNRPLPPKALTLRDIVKFTLMGAGRDLATILTVGVAGALLALLIPIMTGVIVDSVIPEANHRELLQIGLILTVSVFGTFMFQITRAIATVRMEGRMDAELQSAVMDRILDLPTPFFRKFTAGDLANRTLGINQIRHILSGATLTTAMTAIFSSFNLLVMFFYDWKLALTGLAMILVILLISGGLSTWMIRYQRKIFELHGKISGIVLQIFTGIAKLRVTGTEDRGFGVWAESFSRKKAIDFKSGRINAALDTATSFLPMVSTMLIFWFFLRFRIGELSTGHFLAFNSAFSSFQIALVHTTLVFANLLHIIPLWERAKPILSALPEVDEAKAPVRYFSGGVSVDHISFRYSENGPLVLKDVSLNVSPGEFVALVGGSGSGKSTLLRNLLGFEKPDSGSIYYDGRDLADLDIKGVRRQMGVVLQKGQVMPGSILKNITGAFNLTLDDAWEAARMVGLDEDIETMPMGMQTVVPAGGGTLSGGQRQRIIIARAIVRKPRILFFDEATSALDNQTQAIVSESIKKLNVTRLVIAHRLSTIMNADRIYVMEQGRIVESGTYDELMKVRGFFYHLARRQIA
ncbi:MAG: NHLP bacteriocin export ABC transporter permease/ATPase subunit [Deltaproteobacteria bacterium]|nr:NHLP bacteriocin export ABC transporter permease/ATPase subunit [Deltaproteobacteria bacterium]